MKACLLACFLRVFLPATAAAHELETKKAPARSIGKSACGSPAAIYRNRCSRPSSPPILLSRPHNLPSPSQSRHVKGKYFASPIPAAAAAVCAHPHGDLRHPFTHARTHARNPPSGVAPSCPVHRPIALFASAALTPSAMQHALLHVAPKNNARCAPCGH